MDDEQIKIDLELIERLKQVKQSERDKAFGILYKNHKQKFMSFMNSRFGDNDQFEDIYHDAVIIFMKKIEDPGFSLKNGATIQTYLNAIGKYQGFRRFKKGSEPEDIDEISENDLGVDPVDDDSWMEEKLRKLNTIMEQWMWKSKKCYTILYLRFYQKKSHQEIADLFGYAHEGISRNKAHKCLKTLRNDMDKL